MQFLALSSIAHAAGYSNATKAQVEWISLYSGNEANFSDGDRSKVLRALNGLGVLHREHTETREILVDSNSRGMIQDLVAKIFSRASGERSAQR